MPATAVQQANKVEPGSSLVSARSRSARAEPVGAVSGGAAGGILGAQAGSGASATAPSGVGGALAGSLVGAGIEHATSEPGWEYIVRKTNASMCR